MHGEENNDFPPEKQGVCIRQLVSLNSTGHDLDASFL